jgi:hypothetical protein
MNIFPPMGWLKLSIKPWMILSTRRPLRPNLYSYCNDARRIAHIYGIIIY